MHIPEYVEEAIERRFGGRFRLRWSDVEKVYMLEQRVRRTLAEGFAPIVVKSERHRKLTYENQVRARDGYVLDMKIAPGTTTHCLHCDGPIKVPVYEVAQVECPRCKFMGKKSVFAGGFFPISDVLLEHMDRTDPDRGGNERVIADMQQRVARREVSRVNDIVNPAEAAFKERALRIAGIPHTGLSGSTGMWINAPESKPTWGSED